MNLYGFVGNEPLGRWDKLGHSFVAELEGELEDVPDLFDGTIAAQQKCKQMAEERTDTKPDLSQTGIFKNCQKSRLGRVDTKTVWLKLAKVKDFDGVIRVTNSVQVDLQASVKGVDAGGKVTISNTKIYVAKGVISMYAPCKLSTSWERFTCPCNYLESSQIDEHGDVISNETYHDFRSTTGVLDVGQMKQAWESLSIAAEGHSIDVSISDVAIGPVSINP
jgi:hypothetical protein